MAGIDVTTMTDEEFDNLSDEELNSLPDGSTIADGDEPPADEPPADEPPADEPPADEPPADEPPADEPPADEPKKPENLMIPKSRYDSAMARLREQERINQELQNKAPTQQNDDEPEMSALEKQLADTDAKIAEHLENGEYKEGIALQAEARKLERQLVAEQATAVARQTTTAEQQIANYNSLLDRVEAAVPALNPDVEGFDEALAGEVGTLSSAFQAQGEAPAVALERALGYVFPNGWDNTNSTAEPAAETKPEPEPEKPPVEPRKTDVKKNVEAAQRQPPAARGGADSDSAGIKSKIDVMKLSDEDFDKLTDEQLAELGGDNL